MNKAFLYTLALLLFMSLLLFVLCGIDKLAARRKKWRIAERHLLLLALFGGAAGLLAGMACFHHKTKRWYFWLAGAVFLLLQLGLLYFLYAK